MPPCPLPTFRLLRVPALVVPFPATLLFRPEPDGSTTLTRPVLIPTMASPDRGHLYPAGQAGVCCDDDTFYGRDYLVSYTREGVLVLEALAPRLLGPPASPPA